MTQAKQMTEALSEATYAEKEIGAVLPVDQYGASIQIKSTKGSTKWMNLTPEVFDALTKNKAALIGGSK